MAFTLQYIGALFAIFGGKCLLICIYYENDNFDCNYNSFHFARKNVNMSFDVKFTPRKDTNKLYVIER